MCRCSCKKTVTSSHGVLEAHQGSFLRLHVWRLLPGSGMVGSRLACHRGLERIRAAVGCCPGLCKAPRIGGTHTRWRVCEGRPITREDADGSYPVVPAFSPGVAAGASYQSPGARASAFPGHDGGVEPETCAEDSGPPRGDGRRGSCVAFRGTRVSFNNCTGCSSIHNTGNRASYGWAYVPSTTSMWATNSPSAFGGITQYSIFRFVIPFF